MIRVEVLFPRIEGDKAAGAGTRPGETTALAADRTHSDFRNLISCDLCNGVSAW